MNPLFACEIHAFENKHLNQLYDGFSRLARLGVVDVAVKRSKGSWDKPLLTVVLDKKYKVIYDTLDGLNWTDDSEEANLAYFRDSIRCDFYFKRSFRYGVREHTPSGCLVLPLGLNYSFYSEGGVDSLIRQRLKRVFHYLSGYNTDPDSSDFECHPVSADNPRVLFVTRLWDPKEAPAVSMRLERQRLNETRIQCILDCRREFGDKFQGGLQPTPFSRVSAPSLVVSEKTGARRSFLRSIKEHDICIATSGLHRSIGWKFGEYVAASRAIISEELVDNLPGRFENGKNYLQFATSNELIANIRLLIENRQKRSDMMRANFMYYSGFVRPDMLILNSLLAVKKEICR